MKTKCANCKTNLEIDCPLCYVAQLKGKFYCLKCYYKLKAEKEKENEKRR